MLSRDQTAITTAGENWRLNRNHYSTLVAALISAVAIVVSALAILALAGA